MKLYNNILKMNRFIFLISTIGLSILNAQQLDLEEIEILE
jgi:hypothetical protein